MSYLFGADALADWDTVRTMLSRLVLDLAVATLVIQLIYHRRASNREYLLTYYAFNVITCCLTLLLARAAAPLGLGLALFGVFGILRYRTEQIRIRDLTCLFIVIGIGVLNGLAHRSVSVAELLLVNGTIVGMTATLTLGTKRGREHSTPMLYDQLALLRPGSEAALLADLGARTGLPVLRVEVDRYDLLRDAAEITVVSREVPGAWPQPERSRG